MEEPEPIPKIRRSLWKDGAQGILLGGLAGLACEYLNLDVLLLGFNHLVPLAALIGGIVGLTPLRKILLPVNAVMFIAIMTISYTPLAAHLPRGLEQHDSLQPADAVVILGAGYINDETIDAGGQDRILQGLSVLHAGFAHQLVLTHPTGRGGIWPEQIRAELQRLGLNADIIEVGPVVNTHDESIAVAKLCRDHGWKKIILVTHAWHMKRAAALFAKQGVEVIRSPCLESQYDSQLVESPQDRLKVFRSWLHEQVGMWVYSWRGWI